LTGTHEKEPKNMSDETRSYQYEVSAREATFACDTVSEAEYRELWNSDVLAICAHCEDYFAGRHDQPRCFRCIGHTEVK